MANVSTPRITLNQNLSTRFNELSDKGPVGGGHPLKGGKEDMYDGVRKNIFTTPYGIGVEDSPAYVETATSTHAKPLNYAPTPRRISFGDKRDADSSLNSSTEGERSFLKIPTHGTTSAKKSPIPLPDLDVFEEAGTRYTAKRHGTRARFDEDEHIPLRPPSPPVKSPPTSRLFKHRAVSHTPAAQRLAGEFGRAHNAPMTEGAPRRRGHVLDFGPGMGESQDDLLSDSLLGHSGSGRGLFGTSDSDTSMSPAGMSLSRRRESLSMASEKASLHTTSSHGSSSMTGSDVTSVAGGLGSLQPTPSSGNANSSFSSSVDGIEEGEEMDSLLHREFTVIDKLGSGSFGHVLKVRSKINGTAYAVKKSRRPWRGVKERESMLREVRTLVSLGHHPHVVRYHRAWQEKNFLYIQTELCERGSLKQWLYENDNVNEDTLWNFLTDLALGLKHIHAKGLVHMDIKPDNVFLARDGSLKIGDFGVTVSDGTWDDNGEGDSMYLAPELLSYNPTVTASADIFSLGCTMLEMAANIELPTSGKLWQNLRNGIIEFPSTAMCSQEMRAFICHLMDPIPDRRPRAADILEHHIIRKYLRERGGAFNWRHPVDRLGPVITRTLTKSIQSAKSVLLHLKSKITTSPGDDDDQYQSSSYGYDDQTVPSVAGRDSDGSDKPVPGVAPKNLLGEFNTNDAGPMMGGRDGGMFRHGPRRRVRARDVQAVGPGADNRGSVAVTSAPPRKALSRQESINEATNQHLPIRHRYRFERSDSLQDNELLARMAAAAVKRDVLDTPTPSAISDMGPVVGVHEPAGEEETAVEHGNGVQQWMYNTLRDVPILTLVSDILLVLGVLLGVPGAAGVGSSMAILGVIYVVGVMVALKHRNDRLNQSTIPYSPRARHASSPHTLAGISADKVALPARLLGVLVLSLHAIAGGSTASLSLRVQHCLLLSVILVLSHVLGKDTRAADQ